MCWFVASDHVLLRSNRACVAPKQPMFGGYVASNSWSPDAEKSKIAQEQRKIDLNNEFCTVFHVDIENRHEIAEFMLPGAENADSSKKIEK